MKATDLMISDWIMTPDNKPVQVVGLTVDSIETTEKEGYFYDTFFEPIQLIEEILKKNKFKTRGHGDFELAKDIYWFNNAVMIVTDTDFMYICTCYYVHELQHILKLLNINKEIIL